MKRRAFLGSLGTGSLLSLYAAGNLTSGPSLADSGNPRDPKTAATQAPLYWAWWGWEPMDHYRRLGSNTGAVDGSAAWVPPWFDRLHSEELVETMAKLGVNLAITHFFKGFGLKHEREEYQRTAELVRAAHRHGVRVIGYCQSRSLYYETFLAEEPEAEQWIQRDQLGQPRTWGGAYYRWTPCILSQEFRDYLKRVIRVGLEEVGLDGLHFDNDYAEPCYCPRCQRAFRTWLAAQYPKPREHFGLSSFEHVRLPPTQTSAAKVTDPLVREWVRFRCESLGDYHREVTAYARSIRPDVLLLGNPAYPRSPDDPYRRSVWAAAVGRHLNLMFAENGNFPGVADGVLVSQIRAYKQSSAVGYRVVSTTWRRGRETALGLPETPEAVVLQVVEAAANRGVPGTNWALRPEADGSRMRIDQPKLREALGKSLAFVRSHEPLMAGARPVGDVAVLHSFASLAFDAKEAWSQVLGAEEVLIRNGFSWEVVFGDELGRLAGFAVLVVAGQSHLSDQECEAIRVFARQGGGLVLVGDNGYRDQLGNARAQGGLDELSGDRVVRIEAETVRSSITSGYEIRVPLPKQASRLVTAIDKVAGNRLAVRLHGTDTVAVSAYVRDGDRLLVHLINYAAPKSHQNLRLELGSRWKTARTVRVLDLDGPERTVPVERGTVQLPPFATYAIVLVG